MNHDGYMLIEATERKPLINTGRKSLPLQKYPADLDFSSVVAGTTYTVKSHFNKNASECLFVKLCRLLDENKNLAE